MQLEQLPPRKPNFGLVVGLSAVTLIVVLLLGVLFVRWDGKHLSMRHLGTSNTTRVTPMLPAQAPPYLA